MKKRTFTDSETGESFVLDLDSEFTGIQSSIEARKAGVITDEKSKLKGKLLSEKNCNNFDELLDNNNLVVLGENTDDEN